MKIKLQKKKRFHLAGRRQRIRQRVIGTAERPRLTVRFTNLHIHTQCIDDRAGHTLASASTLDANVRGQGLRPNKEGAVALGKLVAERALAAGVTAVVFDRNGRRYHGTVKSFADAAREAGLQF